MLILTRRIGESLKIGDAIDIAVVDIKTNKARLSINGPKDLPVYREEVYKRTQQEKQQATKTAQSLPAHQKTHGYPWRV